MAETLSHIVKEALIGMIATVTDMVPPKDAAPPPFIQAAIDRAVERISAAVPAAEQHPDDVAVDRFAAAMKAKLAAARAKGRYGWDDPEQCSDEELADELVEHLSKGNTYTFEDVANFAMMLHQRGADPEVLATAAAPAQVAQEPLFMVEIGEDGEYAVLVRDADRLRHLKRLGRYQTHNLYTAPAAPAQVAWIPLAIRQPSVGQYVVLAGLQGADAPGRYWRMTGIRRDDGYYDSNGCTCNDATHWVPLPDAPGAAQPAAEQRGTVRVPVETLQHIHRDLDACQKVIWLAGCRPFGYGFDPAYVTEAQARLKEIDALLSKEATHA